MEIEKRDLEKKELKQANDLKSQQRKALENQFNEQRKLAIDELYDEIANRLDIEEENI